MLTTILSILIILLVLLLFLAAVLIFRAVMFGRVPGPVEAMEAAPVDSLLVTEHLAEVIRVQTVSLGENEPVNGAAFEQLHRALEGMYPRLHAALQRERVNQFSLLYTWPGRSKELEPVLLCGHMDVVPHDPIAGEWQHPPFDGAVADGFVWGRGALDMKSTIVSILEAVESLVRAGYQPERTLYLAFGHDEEIGGTQGASVMAKLLAERGVRLAAVLDEGAAVMESLLPGVSVPVALIGIAEKGYASFELRVEGRAGHSSMPPKHTAIGVLARAIARVEAHPMPPRMAMARLMFEDLGAYLPFAMRLALANSWLFGKTVQNRFDASPETGALIRTTQAVTMIQGGIKDNILPAQAAAVVNCRILPGETRETVREHIRRAIDDEAVQIRLDENMGWEPSPVSPVNSEIYQGLSLCIRQVFPDAAVAPYLVAGATDSRYYTAISENVFRFSPYEMNAELVKTIHGVDERIATERLAKMVGFYMHLIQSWTSEA